MWPGAVQHLFNLYLQSSKSSDTFPEAVGKQLSVVLWCLQGKLLTYLHPNSLIRLVTDVLLYHLHICLPISLEQLENGKTSQVDHHHDGDNSKHIDDHKSCIFKLLLVL